MHKSTYLHYTKKTSQKHLASRIISVLKEYKYLVVFVTLSILILIMASKIGEWRIESLTQDTLRSYNYYSKLIP